MGNDLPGASGAVVAGVALISAAVALAACLALARLAPPLGWLDAPAGPSAARKRQRAPVPPVAGAAVLAGWLAVVALLGPGAVLASAHPLLPADTPGELLRWASALALCAAFLVGTLDDVRRFGLSPAAKLGGQLGAGALLALPVWADPGLVPAVQALGVTASCALAAAVALNALNTFDNADGAAGGVTALGLGAGGAPLLGAGVVAVLVPNLLLRRAGTRTPLAYLGDGGSHLLGMALLLVPGAWPVLGLPLLDLARVALERVRDGVRPWRGDRRHLAHRLERRGLGPLRVALILWITAALPLVLPPVLGWSALALAYILLVVASGPAERGACDGPRRLR